MNLIEKAQNQLHTQGGRMTAQRRLILEALQDLSSHPTAEELFRLARRHDPHINLSTVYRTLRWLEAQDLVRSRLLDTDRRQERFDPVFPHEHYHFLCSGCKQVIEFDNLLVNTIKAQFELHTGAQVDSGSVVLHGLCPRCVKQQELARI